MKGKSILLALSGSLQSRYAAEVCWRLAKRLGAEVTAQHVVDTHNAWEFLGQDVSGFIDSQRYLVAYQNLCNSLFTLGEDLSVSYKVEALKQGLQPQCLIDEGNPVAEICNRAERHDLVVMGHQPQFEEPPEFPNSQFVRRSVAESLAHCCQRPLLVVQSDAPDWQSMTIMISIEHINEIFIDSCLDMACALRLSPALVCISGGNRVESPTAFVSDVRAANPRLARVPIAVSESEDNNPLPAVDFWDFPKDQAQWDVWNNTLMVIPTRKLGGQRVTVIGSSVSMFVRYLTLPSILLWPEEHVFSLLVDAGGALSGSPK